MLDVTQYGHIPCPAFCPNRYQFLEQEKQTKWGWVEIEKNVNTPNEVLTIWT